MPDGSFLDCDKVEIARKAGDIADFLDQFACQEDAKRIVLLAAQTIQYWDVFAVVLIAAGCAVLVASLVAWLVQPPVIIGE